MNALMSFCAQVRIPSFSFLIYNSGLVLNSHVPFLQVKELMKSLHFYYAQMSLLPLWCSPLQLYYLIEKYNVSPFEM